jgi:hypothetical protein
MDMQTSLSGRLRNTNLPKTNALLPLFEAVVNSIHSIDERIEKQKDFTMYDARIVINVIRSNQTRIDNEKPELIGFSIEDNGIGFNANNYQSFQMLDSEYKIDKGCRGIGRLLWLKAFQSVSINSNYKENGIIKNLQFKFNAQKNIFDEKRADSSLGSDIKTIVSLNNIIKYYYESIPKTLSVISRSLLEHCLWYFLRIGSAPQILIQDIDETILLNKEYDSYMLNAAKSDSFIIKNQTFEITHVKLKINAKNQNTVSYSAANRLVKNESLKGKIPGLFGTINDGEDEFNYMCFVCSDYLTERVTPERLSFNIAENIEPMFADSEISFNEIRDKVIESVKTYLAPYLEEKKEEGRKKVTDFVNNRAPRYRSILKRIPKDEQIVDPSISDKELELKLHSHFVNFESELISEGHDLMIPQNMEDEEDYSSRIEDYLSKATDIKQSDLANYVTHRKVIIDLLGNALKVKSDGKYVKEEIIHKLIMPMQKNSDEIFDNDSNLWLIDERLSFHNFFASDKTIKSMPITESESTKEPDLFSLNVYDNPILANEGQTLPLASITVVELKRPMRDDAKAGEDKDPIEQALGYLNRIRKGNAKTEDGRPIPYSENIPGFCYILCDLTKTVIERCDMLDLQITSDKMGYFGFHKKYNSYIEVISFDRLLNMAKQRNRAFFDKLGLPTN